MGWGEKQVESTNFLMDDNDVDRILDKTGDERMKKEKQEDG